MNINSSIADQKTDIDHNVVPMEDFGLQSMIKISYDIDTTYEPLIPNGGIRRVPINISYYTISKSPYFNQIILLYCLLKEQYVNVKLDILETPNWCNVIISEYELTFPVIKGKSSQSIYLYIAVDEDAPAYELFNITLCASVDTIKGPFRILPFINGCNNISKIDFVAEYYPLISVTPAYSIINATPGNTIINPITIENFGNGKTSVINEIIDYPFGWSIQIEPQTVIELNERKITNLSIKIPFDFYGYVTIVLSFTPYYYYNSELKGNSTYITIIIIV